MSLTARQVADRLGLSVRAVYALAAPAGPIAMLCGQKRPHSEALGRAGQDGPCTTGVECTVGGKNPARSPRPGEVRRG